MTSIWMTLWRMILVGNMQLMATTRRRLHTKHNFWGPSSPRWSMRFGRLGLPQGHSSCGWLSKIGFESSIVWPSEGAQILAFGRFARESKNLGHTSSMNVSSRFVFGTLSTIGYTSGTLVPPCGTWEISLKIGGSIHRVPTTLIGKPWPPPCL